MVSIVTNGWFSIYAQGAVTSFQPVSAPVAIDLPSAFGTKPLRLLSREKFSEVITHNSNYETFIQHKLSYKEAAKFREKRDALLLELRETAPRVDLVTFSDPTGERGLHLPFDTVVNMHALARSGKVIELIHDETGHTPQVHVRNPSLPGMQCLKRSPLGLKRG